MINTTFPPGGSHRVLVCDDRHLKTGEASEAETRESLTGRDVWCRTPGVLLWRVANLDLLSRNEFATSRKSGRTMAIGAGSGRGRLFFPWISRAGAGGADDWIRELAALQEAGAGLRRVHPPGGQHCFGHCPARPSHPTGIGLLVRDQRD
jgi:hypothetical protein